jgi:hypothetical protein
MILESEKRQNMQKTNMSIASGDPESFAACFFNPRIFEVGSMESFEYKFIKGREASIASYELSAKFNNAAKSIGSNGAQIDIAGAFTNEIEVTINAPSGMSILSVSGGRKTSERTAVSTSGEDFTVTYGEAGEDYTMWILIAVGVLLLIFLAKRKKA